MGLHLFFFPNFPGATIIQGARFIPDSTVEGLKKPKLVNVACEYSLKRYTLESGINVAPWINIAPGKFGKKNKCSPIYTLYLYYLNRLYEVRNKAIALGKKSKN